MPNSRSIRQRATKSQGGERWGALGRLPALRPSSKSDFIGFEISQSKAEVTSSTLCRNNAHVVIGNENSHPLDNAELSRR